MASLLRMNRSSSPLLRPVDALALVFVSTLFLLACAALVRGVPGAQPAAIRLLWSAALILAMRAVGRADSGRLAGLIAACAPIGLAPVDWALDPIVDLLNPTLRDGALLAADRFLFRETPSVLLQDVLTPGLTEALLIGYLSYFTLLLAPIVLLWLRRDDESAEGYVRLLTALFVTNLSFYALVPAVGPRFALAAVFAQPIHGVWLGDWIRGLFLDTPFFRDCFPSGHAAGTLLALIVSFKKLRGWFFVTLPLGALCISATVLCRYHYGVDLLFALPLAAFAWRASRVLVPGALAELFPAARGAVREER